VRAWPWVAAGALVAVAGVSCLDRAPSQRASAQPKAQAPTDQPAAGAKAEPVKPQPAAAQAEEKKTHEVVLEHADRWRYDNKTKEYELVGGIVVRHEDGVLRAQTMRLNRETKKGYATGDLSFADEQTRITADRMDIDFDAREAVFKGDVRMVAQKKPATQPAGKPEGQANARKEPGAAAEPATQPAGNPSAAGAKGNDEEVKPFREYWSDRVEIRCPELAYSYRDNRAVARGGVTARQKDRSGRADEATYTDDDEMLVLSGNVEMTDERGQTFHADKITISVGQDWVEALGAVSGRFLVEEKEAKGKAAPPAGESKEPQPAPPAAEKEQAPEKAEPAP
jgi:lipopolysaccharide assembly outer membrane protein LptD (OstA)